jgi:glyoxylase-like metal-dependent hydrolase (beta-lactamase superfamily II)
MTHEVHRFDVGDFRCTLVLDGTHTYPEFAKKRFVGVPDEDLEEAMAHYGLAPESDYESPYPTLLVDTGRNLVLIDTGAGNLFPTTGRLLPNLRAAGFEPGDVDTVILTHGHPDHIAGTLDSQGTPAFPGATYYMWRSEWDFWYPKPNSSGIRHTGVSKQRQIDCALRYLPPIADRVEPVETETEVVSGVHTVAAPGHTCGHMAVSLVSRENRFLFASDAFISKLQVDHPDWTSLYDYDAAQGVETRRRLLKVASSGGFLIQMFHFPFPGLGRFVRKGADEYEWHPLDS